MDDRAPLPAMSCAPSGRRRACGTSTSWPRDVDVETDEEQTDGEDLQGGGQVRARAGTPFVGRPLLDVMGDRCQGVQDEVVELTDRAASQASHQLRGSGAAWWTHARCNDGSGRLADVFFSREPPDIARAKRLCLSCPALIPCLEGALERREPWGVWGGQLFVNGTIVATKRRRGRPPKVPRPEDQVPEVPIPQHLRGVPVVGIA